MHGKLVLLAMGCLLLLCISQFGDAGKPKGGSPKKNVSPTKAKKSPVAAKKPAKVKAPSPVRKPPTPKKNSPRPGSPNAAKGINQKLRSGSPPRPKSPPSRGSSPQRPKGQPSRGSSPPRPTSPGSPRRSPPKGALAAARNGKSPPRGAMPLGGVSNLQNKTNTSPNRIGAPMNVANPAVPKRTSINRPRTPIPQRSTNLANHQQLSPSLVKQLSAARRAGQLPPRQQQQLNTAFLGSQVPPRAQPAVYPTSYLTAQREHQKMPSYSPRGPQSRFSMNQKPTAAVFPSARANPPTAFLSNRQSTADAPVAIEERQQFRNSNHAFLGGMARRISPSRRPQPAPYSTNHGPTVYSSADRANSSAFLSDRQSTMQTADAPMATTEHQRAFHDLNRSVEGAPRRDEDELAKRRVMLEMQRERDADAAESQYTRSYHRQNLAAADDDDQEKHVRFRSHAQVLQSSENAAEPLNVVHDPAESTYTPNQNRLYSVAEEHPSRALTQHEQFSQSNGADNEPEMESAHGEGPAYTRKYSTAVFAPHNYSNPHYANEVTYGSNQNRLSTHQNRLYTSTANGHSEQMGYYNYGHSANNDASYAVDENAARVNGNVAEPSYYSSNVHTMSDAVPRQRHYTTTQNKSNAVADQSGEADDYVNINIHAAREQDYAKPSYHQVENQAPTYL